jgi:SpoVK/Ycf46/Vps4 family AAA+-type ATPase
MTALEAYPGIVLLASNLKGNIDSAFLRRIRHVVEFQKPSAEARERIWQQVVQALFPPDQVGALQVDLPRLARMEATGAVIKNAALSALFTARRARQAPSARLLAKEGAGISERDLETVLEESWR